MKSRFWMWPNLLSLDAPAVALVWQILFARCFQVPVDALASLLLVLTVWLIYAADHTLDAWKGRSTAPRHEFHRRHWRLLFPIWMTVLVLTAWLAVVRLSAGVFWRGGILLAGVGLHFAVVHAGRRRWPKEAAVAILFALGASLVAWGRVRTPADGAAILLFSGLCWMNCIAIQKWESDGLDWSPCTAAMVLACGSGVLLYADRPILGGAELASAAAFVLLDRVRPKLSADAVRVLADVALLSPVLFLPMAVPGPRL